MTALAHVHTTGAERAPSNALGSLHVTTFDAPGAAMSAACDATELFFDCGTQATAINNQGTITGFYLDSTLRGTAFIRKRGGEITTFEVPAAGGPLAGTSAVAISDNGTTGGSFEDAQFVSHSFVRLRNGKFVTFDPTFASVVPNAPNAQGSELSSFNDGERLAIAGNWYDSQGTAHAYIGYSGGKFADVDPPGAVSAVICPTDCFSNGMAAGNFRNGSFASFGYVRTPSGALSIVNVPNSLFQQVSGINERGKLTGFYVDTNGVAWAFIASAHGSTIPFQAPDASVTDSGGTEAAAINAIGGVTGMYFDAALGTHGFYRSPSGQFAEFDPVGSIATVPQAINDRGDVAGLWYDAHGISHAFVWMPH